MIIRKIIAPTDLSQHAEAGIRYAVELARERNAVIIALQVTPLNAWELGLLYRNAVARERDPAAVLHEMAGAKLCDLDRFMRASFPAIDGIAVRPAVSFGNVANEIVSAAHEQKADLIVMAKRKRGVLGRLVGKSISETVSRRTDCPVLTFYPESETPALWSGRIGLAEQAVQGFAA